MTEFADRARQPNREHPQDRIPGWGADRERADRPSVPKEQPVRHDASYSQLAPQSGRVGRERSLDYPQLTPVFGIVAPLHGLSGVVRRQAYERYSEAQTAHWLLLMAADRIDVLEHRSAHVARIAIPVLGVGLLLGAGVLRRRRR